MATQPDGLVDLARAYADAMDAVDDTAQAITTAQDDYRYAVAAADRALDALKAGLVAGATAPQGRPL